MRSAVRLLLLLVGFVAIATHARAAAWVETTVVSDAVTVQVERDGRATVSHATALRVRGGPLKTWTLQGVDRDAEPLPDSYVVSTSSEKAASSRKELILVRGDDESLRIDVADDKGLRQGTYLLQFSYHTDFRVSKMLRARGGMLELAWVGPRFSTGLDGAKATFRIPSAATPPRAAEVEAEPNSLDDPAVPLDSFVSSVRRGAQFDEVELIRAHVAQGEPVLWRVWSNPAAFDASVFPGAGNPGDTSAPIPQQSAQTGASDAAWALVAGVAALCWIAAFTFKLRRYTDDCRSQGVRPRALIPLNAVWRIALSGALIGAAVMAAWAAECPNLAVGCGILAMLLVTQRSPAETRALRGPGVWLPLTDAEAFAPKRAQLRARYFDVSLWQGRVALAAFMLLVCIATYLASRRSPYDAALTALLLPLALPLFVTALSRQLPRSRAERKRAWLSRLHHRLAQLRRAKVIAWARFPDGEGTPDELRLRLVACAPVEGLIGIELAYSEAAADELARASLIIRAKEGSAAQRVWQNRLVWQRGRRADERVAVYDIDWPVIDLAVDTVKQLLVDLSAQRSKEVPSPTPRSNASRSCGSGSRQSKGGNRSMPLQAIR